MPDPKMTADFAWLAETMRRNRAMFGGWRMEIDAGEGAGDGSDTGAGDGAGDREADAGKAPPWGDAANFDAEKAWGLIQRLRSEKGDPAKVTDLEKQVTELQAAQQAQIDAIAKAAGLKPDDTPADPAALAKQIADEQAKVTAAETRAANAERRLAVHAAASTHDANPAALLDSASFLAALEAIDASDADAIGAAIKTAVESDERFKLTPPAPSFFGGPRKPSGPPDPGPGLARMRDAYAQSSK